MLGTYNKFFQENNFPAPGFFFPQPCSSAGCRFAVSRSRLQNYRRNILFSHKKFDEMRCRVDSIENLRSFEKCPTHLKLDQNGLEYFLGSYVINRMRTIRLV